MLKRMAAAKKQMVATMPASTGRAKPSSVRSGCGNTSGENKKEKETPLNYQNILQDARKWENVSV